MVLAAGLGTRMRPLTVDRPKPLVEVGGATLLDRTLGVLAAGGVRHAIVNVHYLADMMEAHLASERPPLALQVSDERAELLETGGGIVKALPLLGSDPFLAINCDNIWCDAETPAVASLLQEWDEARMDGLLLMVPIARARCHGARGDFLLAEDGRISRPAVRGDAPCIYTGLQLLSKRLFAGAEARPFSLNLLWDKAIAAGRLFGAVYDGLWFDVGTPDAVREVERHLGAR